MSDEAETNLLVLLVIGNIVGRGFLAGGKARQMVKEAGDSADCSYAGEDKDKKPLAWRGFLLTMELTAIVLEFCGVALFVPDSMISSDLALWYVGMVLFTAKTMYEAVSGKVSGVAPYGQSIVCYFMVLAACLPMAFFVFTNAGHWAEEGLTALAPTSVGVTLLGLILVILGVSCFFCENKSVGYCSTSVADYIFGVAAANIPLIIANTGDPEEHAEVDSRTLYIAVNLLLPNISATLDVLFGVMDVAVD